MSHEYIVKQSEEICKCLNQLRFRKILSDVYMEHIMAIIHSVFMPGYHGKIANTKYFSEKYRTSVAHFLNDGKWDSLEVEWLLLSLVHFLCCTLPDYRGAFEKGLAYFQERLLQA